MKKLESTWYNMAIVLTVISVVAGAALAYVNEMTKGPIAEIQQRNEAQAIKAVLCDDNAVVTDTIEGEAGVVVYLTDNGAAVKTVDPQNGSFSGGLTVMVGLNKEFQVLGYTVLVSNETPGLGAKASEWFQKGNKGDIIGKRDDLKIKLKVADPASKAGLLGLGEGAFANAKQLAKLAFYGSDCL